MKSHPIKYLLLIFVLCTLSLQAQESEIGIITRMYVGHRYSPGDTHYELSPKSSDGLMIMALKYKLIKNN